MKRTGTVHKSRRGRAAAKYHRPLITVAEYRIDIAPFRQVHDQVQCAETVGPFFQKISVQNQQILIGKADLFQQCFEIGEIPVDIGYDNGPLP